MHIITKLFYFSLLIIPLFAQAQSGTFAADDVQSVRDAVEDFHSLIPPEYLQIIEARRTSPDDGFSLSFSTPLESADCKLGLRFGKRIALSVLSRLKPTCDRLLAPIGSEWIPPEQSGQSDAFATCYNHAYSWYAMQTVYQTAELCAWSGFETSILAGQLEYNRCYLAVANAVTFSNVVKDPYRPGALTLIPADSTRWSNMLSSIRSQNGQQSGYLSMLCEIGKTDAESGYPPVNILSRR